MHDATIIHSFLHQYLIRSKCKTKIPVNNYLLAKTWQVNNNNLWAIHFGSTHSHIQYNYLLLLGRR